jgi:hypothetical protein
VEIKILNDKIDWKVNNRYRNAIIKIPIG